jgi:hypothetical protein
LPGGSPGADDVYFAADNNADGAVNRRDLALFSLYIGATTGADRFSGDATGDGIADLHDLAVLQRTFGSQTVPSPEASPAAVPEETNRDQSPAALQASRVSRSVQRDRLSRSAQAVVETPQASSLASLSPRHRRRWPLAVDEALSRLF